MIHCDSAQSLANRERHAKRLGRPWQARATSASALPRAPAADRCAGPGSFERPPIDVRGESSLKTPGGDKGPDMVLDEFRQSSDTSLKALSIILDAWDAGAEDGVAPEIMAYAAIYTALTDLVSLFGEEAVAALAGNLVRKVQKGDFTMPEKSCH